jgi:hypothetical protein
MYRAPHPWIAASQWIYHALPPGTTIAVERWDDPLPLDISVDGVGYLRDQVYDTHMLDPFAEPDNEQKLSRLVGGVAQADYLILSSNRVYGVIPRLRERYPLTSAYYCLLFSGELGFAVRHGWHRPPMLGGVALLNDPLTRTGLPTTSVWEIMSLDDSPTPIVLGYADESFTVYDHPLALLFVNNSRLPVAELTHRILDESQAHRTCR